MKAFVAGACVAVGLVGCVARPPPELEALQSSSVCEVDSDCCLVVDSCSVADFAVDRTQVAEAREIASLEIPYEACARTFADPQRLTPTCQDGSCVVVDASLSGDDGEEKSDEQIALEACRNPAITVDVD
jgi:hypothetical protein